MLADDAAVTGSVDLEQRDVETGVRIGTPDLVPLPNPDLHARLALANWTDEERRLGYRLTKDGIEIAGKKGRSRIRWPAIHRFAEGPACFVLQASEALRTVIPKRAFAEAELPLVRAMFIEWVTPRPSTVKPRTPKPVMTLVLWLAVVVLFLAVWQLFGSAQP
jgi:hypothetical protein